MVNYNKFNKNVLFICLSLMGGVSYAADSDDPIRQRIQADQTIRQQQRDTALEKQIQPNVSVNLGQEQNKISAQQLQYLHSNSETPCFEIKKILLEGDLAHQFISSFNVVTTGKNNIIGRCLGVNGLNQALDLVQNKIIADGYVTTRVLLPQQNIASGTVRVHVIPGRVDQIKFADGTSKRAHLWNALPMKSGALLNIRDMEQGLENFKRVPTVEADFKIQPAEQKNEPGYSDVILAWQQAKPYRLHVGIDDSGSDATGKYQGTATLSLDHVLTLNDLFYISYNHDLGSNGSGKHGTDGFYASYTIPFDY